ncbi:MAG: hypothetical protein GC145_14440 [Caulobacter sp.]|nr:hypothetical protein [Caulobacter sp.]
MAFDGTLISETEWATHRREAMQALPAALVEGISELPDILMPSQKRLLMATASNQLVVSDKSRRIGFTWAIGADAVLTAGRAKSAKGMDVLYIGYNLDMAREFIDCCAMWARAFMPACTEVSEFLFKDGTEKAADEGIKAFRIGFKSGFEIIALTSKPRSLRGRQGYVILDEFAFHEDPEGLLKAAMALLIWGGKVLVISTHNGVDNPFNQLITEVRSKKRPGEVVRCTFDDALEQGLYQRICLMRGIEWTPEGEAAFRSEIRAFYGADQAEELDCVPSQGSGVYFTRAVIEACSVEERLILRLTVPREFELKPKAEREAYVQAWLEQVVAPELAKLDKGLRHFFGQDFALTGDVSSVTPMFIDRQLNRQVPFEIEMRGVPHEQQKQVLFYVVDRLPRFSGGKIDSNGNGSYLGQVTMQEYGAHRIEQVKPSQAWYLANMPPLKAGFEDRTVWIPAHPDLVDDLRQVKLIRGVPMVPSDAHTKGADGLPRHGDFAVSLCLAHAASLGEVSEYAYQPVSRPDPRAVDRDDDDDDASSSFSRDLRVQGTL